MIARQTSDKIDDMIEILETHKPPKLKNEEIGKIMTFVKIIAQK